MYSDSLACLWRRGARVRALVPPSCFSGPQAAWTLSHSTATHTGFCSARAEAASLSNRCRRLWRGDRLRDTQGRGRISTPSLFLDRRGRGFAGMHAQPAVGADGMVLRQRRTTHSGGAVEGCLQQASLLITGCHFLQAWRWRDACLRRTPAAHATTCLYLPWGTPRQCSDLDCHHRRSRTMHPHWRVLGQNACD